MPRTHNQWAGLLCARLAAGSCRFSCQPRAASARQELYTPTPHVCAATALKLAFDTSISGVPTDQLNRALATMRGSPATVWPLAGACSASGHYCHWHGMLSYCGGAWTVQCQKAQFLLFGLQLVQASLLCSPCPGLLLHPMATCLQCLATCTPRTAGACAGDRCPASRIPATVSWVRVELPGVSHATVHPGPHAKPLL